MPITTYAQYQDLAASEKVGLVVLDAGMRLMGWVVHSGSVYKITSFDQQVISSIEDSGVAYSSVASIATVIASTYFHDRANRVLYLRASDSSNPNSRYLIGISKLFFSNFPVKAPWDLATGFEVEWLPLLDSTSTFSLEIDNQNQIGNAIEGSGQVTLFNDSTYWQSRFDGYFFEAQKCSIYSWNTTLPIAQATLIFRAQVESKSWGMEKISFHLKDQFFALRGVVDLEALGTVAGARINSAFENYKQRRLYGKILGHRTQNIDQILSIGYPLTGTMVLTNGFPSMDGTATAFLSQLWKGDKFTFDGSTFYDIKNSTYDAVSTLSETFTRATIITPQVGYVKPTIPRRWMNRKHLIAGHILHAPSTTIASVGSDTSFTLTSAAGFFAGDYIEVVGKNTNAKIQYINGNRIKLMGVLGEDPLVSPAVADTVKRHAVQNVYFNSRVLPRSDYTLTNTATAYITLSDLMEFNLVARSVLTGTISCGGNPVIYGTATKFNTELKQGDWISLTGSNTFYEVIEIQSDIVLYLSSNGFNAGPVTADYKKVTPYAEGTDIISVDCYGISTTATTAGTLILTGPEIVSDLVSQAGLSANISSASFATAKELAPYPMSLVIPDEFGNTTLPSVRDSITRINKSIFGALILNADFLLEYAVLSPERAFASVIKLVEHDILSLSIDSTSANIVWKSRIRASAQEYDPDAAKNSFVTLTATNNYGQYVAKSEKEFELHSTLAEINDAQLLANRYAFLMELGSSQVKLESKMRLSRLKVTDKIEILHEKLYYRIGSSSSRRVGEIQLHRKSITGSGLDLEDFTNAMVRAGLITGNSAPNFAASSDTDKLYSGYITDQYGLISNAASTYNTNLQW